MLLHVLDRRLGPVPFQTSEAVSKLSSQQLRQLFDIALETDSWDEIEHLLAELPPSSSVSSGN
jgi:hypothetical protein